MRPRIATASLFAFLLGLVSPIAIFAQNDIKVEGAYHIEKNQRHGWLILNLEIPKGYHVYALTQKGSPPPTKIDLKESEQFELLKKFEANRKPHVVEHDPVFDQRIETYEGKIALRAPIRIASDVDLENVDFDLKISGQLCNDSGCRLFNGKSVEIEFAGFYEKEEKKEEKKEIKK